MTEQVNEQVSEVTQETEVQPEQQQQQSREDVDFAKRFAVLSRREKELLHEKQQFKQESEEVKKFKQILANAKQNPKELMEMAGLSYKEITDFFLNDEQPTAETRIEMLERQIKEEREERERFLKQQEQERVDQTIAQLQNNIKETVDNSDDFELIRINDSYDLVYNVIEEHYSEYGEVLPIKDAAQKVEEYLDEHVRGKILKTKRYSSLAEGLQESPQGEGKTATPTTTLTNSALASSTPPSNQYLDDDTSKQKIAEWLNSQLNK